MIKYEKDHLSYSICLVPFIVAAVIWLTRAFPDTLSHNEARVNSLSPAEKVNIKLACHKINSFVLNPGETFSFNRLVGPRTSQRGFLEAGTYENGRTIKTEGGGICLVSSLLYKSALEAGLKVTKRQPHSRPVRSVGPGLDATVIYGRYDLEFKNDTNTSVRIEAGCDTRSAEIKVSGKRSGNQFKLITTTETDTKSELIANVYKKQNENLVLITSDRYMK